MQLYDEKKETPLPMQPKAPCVRVAQAVEEDGRPFAVNKSWMDGASAFRIKAMAPAFG